MPGIWASKYGNELFQMIQADIEMQRAWRSGSPSALESGQLCSSVYTDSKARRLIVTARHIVVLRLDFAHLGLHDSIYVSSMVEFMKMLAFFVNGYC